MKAASSEGANLSHRHLHFILAAGLALMVAGCKKNKENSAVIEEVPAAAPAAETDTSATLAEEPNLQQVGKDKPGSAKSTFHPSGKGKSAAGSAPASAGQAGFSDAGRFVVQVAVFKSKKQAAGLVEKLAGQGYPAYVAEVENPIPDLAGTYHRVRIGKFQTIADAKAFGANTLKPLGYDFWVDNKKNDGVGGMGGAASAPVSEPAPAAEAPAPHKGKKSKAVAAKAAASESANPPSGTWEASKAPAEPPAPSGGTWGNPATEAPPAPEASEPNKGAAAEKPAAAELPGTKPAAPAATAPASTPEPAKKDTGKVNLDEW